MLVPEFHTTDIDGQGFGKNYSAFSSKAVDERMNQIQRLPLDQQPADRQAQQDRPAGWLRPQLLRDRSLKGE